MVQLMPNEYECSVGKLQQILSDESICLILSSGSSAIANKTILDCLIDKIRNKEEILDFCDQLESISKSYELIILTYKIRSGKQYFRELICTYIYIQSDSHSLFIKNSK